MAMFPIFMIGLIVGIAISYAFCMYKKDIPSDVKIHLQQAEIIKQRNDIETLQKLNDELTKKINKKGGI